MKLKYYFRVSFVFTLLFSVNSFAQKATIKGTVYSEGRPLAGVTIKTNHTEETTTSKESGKYELYTVPGKIELNASLQGFVSYKKTVNLLKGERLNLDIDMPVDALQLDEIKVVSKSLGLTEQTPYNITTIDASELSVKGTPSGIMGQLKELPGVNGADLGHGIVKPLIRGLGFSRVVTSYQGSKLENHQWGADHGLGLNDVGIGSADVIKGPASILYGSGAIGGVIILNDEERYLDNNRFNTTVGTTINTVSAGVRTYGSVGKKLDNGVFFAFDGAYENHADYFDGNNRLIGNSRFNTATSRFHFGYQSGRIKSKLSYTYNTQQLGIIDDNEMEPLSSLATNRGDRDMQLPFQNITDHIISYNQSYRISENWNTQTSLSYHYNQREEIEDDFEEVDLGLKQNHAFYNLRAIHSKSRKLTNTFGLQGSFIDMKNTEEAKEILFSNASYFENGAYYLGTYTIKSHTLQGGVRFDYRYFRADANQDNIISQGYVLPGNPTDRKLQNEFSGLTGSLGYIYKLNNKNRFKVNISSGFRAPDLAELLSNGPHPGTNRFELGHINFNREQSLQGDISWIKRSKQISVDFSIFSNFVSDYIYFAATGDTTLSGLNIWEFRQTDAFLYGGEVAVKYKPNFAPNFTTQLRGNVTRGLDIPNNRPLTFIPADRVVAKINYSPINNNKLVISSGYEYAFMQNRPGLQEVTTDGYGLLRASIKYTWDIKKHDFSIAVTGFNLLNTRYIDHVAILRAFNVSHPGRNVMINLQWQF